MPFCTDVDLLHWEPNLLRDAIFASQVLLSGTGDLSGTSFTIDTGSLTSAKVGANHVIVLAGAVAGCFPIVSVDSSVTLTLSVLYDGLFPPDGGNAAEPVGAGTAGGLTYSIRTFSPQASVVSELLKQSAGIDPGSSDEIVNPTTLKRACTLGTLQMIYNALAAAAEEPADLQIRAELYQRLYRRAFRNLRVEIDTDGDGAADVVRHLNILKLTRA